MSLDAESQQGESDGPRGRGEGSVGGRTSWREADRQLRRIAARRAALDAETAHWLLVARRARAHEALGFATFLEYVERRLGYAPHTAIERLRVAEALEMLPATRDALTSGRASYTAIREISRIATPETEAAWLDASEDKTVREVEMLVRGHKRGDLPTDPADPDLEPRTLRLALSPDVYGLFLQTRRHLEDVTGERLSDNDLLRAMCQAALAGGSETQQARPEMVLTVCENCERGQLDVAGQTLDVAPAVVAEVKCDVAGTKDVPRGTRKNVWQRDRRRCTVPGCRGSRFLHLHHIVPRAEGGSHDPINLTLLCTAHHRAHHEGRLSIRGTAPDALEFRHADGTKYGAAPTEAAASRRAAKPTRARTSEACEPVRDDGVFADATKALVGFGYKRSEARAAVARARSHVGPGTPLEVVIKACLRECGSARRRDGC